MEPTPAAPAQPDGIEAPVVEAPALNPLQQAVVNGDLTAFRESKRAGAKIDDAPTAVESVAVAPAKVDEARLISKRQETINNYERRIAEQDAELTRLRASLAPPALRSEPVRPAAPAQPDPTDPEPDPTDTAKYPDGQYDPKFIRELGAHAARTEYRAREAEAQTRAEVEARTATFRERDTAFQGRLADAKAADPDFLTKLSPDIRALQPMAYFAEDGQFVQVKTPTVQHAIAEEILRSPQPAALMLHLSAHPEDFKRLADSKSHSDLVRTIARLELDATKAPDVPVPPTKTVSSAPPPAPVLGTRPTEGADPIRAAVVNDDFRAFRAAKQAARAAHR